MGIPKKLYFGKDVEDLQKKAKLGDTSKWTVKALCNSSEKVFKEAVIQKDLGDEEKAYVYFFKYIELVEKIRKNANYKKDPKYFNNMHSIQKNFKKAIETLEALTLSLETRYSEKYSVKINENLKDSVEINEPIRKLDVNSNIDTAKNGLEKDIPRENLISYRKLHSLFQEKSTTFLILDTRPVKDYENSKISHPSSINIPESCLMPGITAESIGKNLKVEYRDQWQRRSQMDMLIICDWTSNEFSPGKPISVLKDAITIWDHGTAYAGPPYLLDGGFEKFLYAYPHSVTNPKARAPAVEKVSSVSSIPSLDINYPDLDNGFMVTPSPSPKSHAAINSGAIKISKQPQPADSHSSQYPNLADIGNMTPKSISKNAHPTVIKQAFQPTIPDRSTKPNTSISSKGLHEHEDGKDNLNEAKHSFDLQFHNSTSGSMSSTLSDGMMNNARIESSSNSNLPKVDRGTKNEAILKYSSDKLDSMEDVLKTQNDIADDSLDRVKAKLDLENKWEFLRQKKEAELENQMQVVMISEQQDKLVEELDRLQLQDKIRDEEERRLEAELDEVKKKLKEKEDQVKQYIQNEEILEKEKEKAERQRKLERAKEEELVNKYKQKVEMMESLNRKRKERKEVEQKRREERRNSPAKTQHHHPSESPSRQSYSKLDRERGGAGALRLKLRSDDDSNEAGGNLKRSFSSPNIAQMLEQEAKGPLNAGFNCVPVPKFDRKQKPSLISSRNFAGKWGTQKPGLTGLKNLGNTCYMNSILQCVSNTPPLAHYFVSRSFDEDLNKYSETKGHVAHEFSDVLTNLWNSQFKSISPSDFKHVVGRFKSEFAGRDQQDSHEFVSKLLEWLHSDTNKVMKPSKEPEQNNTDSKDKNAAKNHWRNYLERNQSIIVQLFCGQTRSTVMCFSCKAESVTYREFTNLTLPLPETSSRVNLRECFREYLREEKIDEFTCDRCKNTGKASKKMDIVKLPPLLIIHLSRFYQDGMYTRKKQNFVDFELKNLHLGQYALQGFENKFSDFNLYAVSNHFGSLEGGHYTAYCSSSVLKRWHKYDDQDVSTMDMSDVVTPAAYILFYSAIEGRNTLPPLG